MARAAAGLLLFRGRGDGLELLLGHMGGPLWARKDDHAWTIFKGEYDAEHEHPLAAAYREFTEETGHDVPPGEPLALGTVRQSGGKRVTAWALEGDLDAATVTSNTFTMVWPPRSGREQTFPEIDRAQWCDSETARRLLVKAQATFVDRLVDALA